MEIEVRALIGQHVVLEPLRSEHVPALVSAAAADPSLYRWTPVPQGIEAMTTYADSAISQMQVGDAAPFAIVRRFDAAVVGCTRFWNVKWWSWPEGNYFSGRSGPDVCEIGYTWLSTSAIRTPVNTEAKLLLLTYAFEEWKVHRVCFHTDVRNERSRAALARIGAQFEGVLRCHRLAADNRPRDSARFSILAAEWSDVKQNLTSRLGEERG